MEANNQDDLRAIVTRLALLVETIGTQQQQMHADFQMMAERWEGYIIEQRQFNQRFTSFIEEQRDMNAHLRAILEQLLPGSGNGRQQEE